MNNEFSDSIPAHGPLNKLNSDNKHDDSDDEEAVEEEKRQAFLSPSRWWFASTAFPLIAGTFGPMASAFSVVALVIKWRTIVPDGGTDVDGIFVEDPVWYVIGRIGSSIVMLKYVGL